MASLNLASLMMTWNRVSEHLVHAIRYDALRVRENLPIQGEMPVNPFYYEEFQVRQAQGVQAIAMVE